MLPFPAIDPVAFSLGPIKVHWYGLMYLAGFLIAWLLAHWRVKHYHLEWTSEQIGDLIFMLLWESLLAVDWVICCFTIRNIYLLSPGSY